jgi:hypothetical protein
MKLFKHMKHAVILAPGLAVGTAAAFISNRSRAKNQSLIKNRWMYLFAVVSMLVGATVALPLNALATAGGVIVSAQNDCAVGPTNDNFLPPDQTAYVWLIFNSATSVSGYTYEITGTSNPFDSGILKIRFYQCKKSYLFWGKFTTPLLPGGYTMTVFNQFGAKVSSDNFTVN